MEGIQFTPKKFWERPEGITGTLFLGVLAIAAIMGIGTILPWIISLLANTLTAIALFATVAVAIMVITNKRVWTLTSMMFKSAMRALTGIFITIDPIGILKNYLDKAEQNKEKFSEQRAALRGQKRTLEEKIKQNTDRAKEELGLAKAAKEKGNDAALILNSRKAGRLQESVSTLTEIYDKIIALEKVLDKMFEATSFYVEDLKSEIEVQSEKYEMMKKSFSALMSAKKVINGDQDDRAVFDQTMEYLTSSYGQKLGEIENFMIDTKGMIDNMDLQNAAFESNALQQIQGWDQKATKLITQREVFKLPAPAEKETVPVQSAGKQTSRYF